jgi:sugar phosphate permease
VSTASVPSVILCTLVGDRVSKGDFKTAIILAAILIVLILFIVIFRKRIIDTIERVFH